MKNKRKIVMICLFLMIMSLFNTNIAYGKFLHKKKVLIIHSYNKGDIWVDNIEEAIIKSLSPEERNIDIQIEYMDSKRINKDDYLDKLIELYKHKYEKENFDLIISSDNDAFNFLVDYRDEIFPIIPVVLCGVNDFDYSLLKGEENITGITEEIDIQSNIELVLKLQSDIEQIIAIIDDTMIGEKIENNLKMLIKDYNLNVPIKIIKDRSIEGTIQEIRDVSSKSAILFMASRLKFRNGDIVPSHKALNIIRDNTKSPIYGIWDQFIGNGLIGGRVASSMYHGQMAGEMGKKILEGEFIENIPIKINEPNQYIFDYNELQRFGIKLSQLPEGSAVINKLEAVYSINEESMKEYVAGLIIIFAMIIVILIINILMRRRSEKALKENELELQRNFRFLRSLLDAIPNPIFCKDADMIYTECNTAYEECLGIKKEKIIGSSVYDINQEELADIYFKADSELMKSKAKQVYETKFKFADGIKHDVIFSKATLISDENEADGIVGVMLDITERKNNERKINRLAKLKEAVLEVNHVIIGTNSLEELFELILDKAIDAIDNAKYGSILVLKDDRMLEIAACKGYSIEKARRFSIPLEHSFQWLITKGNIQKTVVINNIDGLESIKVLDIKKEREQWEIKSCISSPIIIENKLYGMLNIDSDRGNVFNEEDIEIMEYLRNQIEIAISKHKLYEEMIYLSRYDKLTNVYNRRYFEELFDRYFKKSVKENKEFSLVIFDLNGLKIVNDTYGHLAGDLYIKTFSDALSNRMNSSDILARYGGDEFAAVFLNTEPEEIAEIFEELLKELEENPIIFQEDEIICSFSYGISQFPHDAETYNHLVKVADERMYEYKQSFKKRVSVI